MRSTYRITLQGYEGRLVVEPGSIQFMTEYSVGASLGVDVHLHGPAQRTFSLPSSATTFDDVIKQIAEYHSYRDLVLKTTEGRVYLDPDDIQLVEENDGEVILHMSGDSEMILSLHESITLDSLLVTLDEFYASRDLVLNPTTISVGH